MEYTAIRTAPPQKFPHQLDASECYAGVLVGLVACDDTVTHEEALEVTRALSRCSLFIGLNDKHVRRVLKRLGSMARTAGPLALLEAAAPGVPRDLREGAFAWAVELAYADGSISDREVEFLKRSAELLALPNEQVAKILEVTRIRYGG